MFVNEIKGLEASTKTFSKAREGTWSHMLSNDAYTSKIRSIIEEGMIVKVENGNTVQFWHDRWCEIGPLKRVFARLFTLSLQKNLLISQMGTWNEGAWSWNLRWRRTMYEWEIDEALRLKHLIEQKMSNTKLTDGVYWKQSGNLCFPVKSIVAKMYDSHASTLSKNIVNIVWQKFIPPRAQLSIWLANLEKLKTGDFLVEKGIINSQQADCPFCSLETESNSHVLFTCRFSWSSWMKMLEWWGLSGVLHNRCENFSIEWFGLVKSRKCRKLWGLILGCGIWSLWYERNKIKFDMGSPELNTFVYSLKIRVGIWAKEMLGYTGVAPHDIIHNIDSILMQA